MPNPRDPIPQLGVPLDPWTRRPVTPVQLERMAKYRDAEHAFFAVLHELDGSSEGSDPGDKRMQEAFGKIYEASYWVMAVILDHKRG